MYLCHCFIYLLAISFFPKAGSYIREELVSTIIAMISENTEEHVYSVQRLYQALNEDISQQSLSQVATWTIGEFGDLLITAPMEIEGEALDVSVCQCFP